MQVPHRDEAAFVKRAPAPFGVLKRYRSQEHAATKIKLLAIGQECHGPHVEPVLCTNVKLEFEPVGKINEVFVFNYSSGNVSVQPVIPAREVRPRIVHVVGNAPWHGRTSREVAVAEGTQGLPDAFMSGLETREYQ